MTKEQLGAFIAENRRDRGMTQRDLAEWLHITDKAVSKWERGLSYPDVTLLEPLAEVFGLGVEELVACRRAEEKLEDEQSVKSILEISRENRQSDRRKNVIRTALSALVMVGLALLVVWYSATFVHEQREQTIFLKETVGNTNYLYVEEEGHLLRLKCGDSVDFDAIELIDPQWSDERMYRLDCRWNKKTYQGTVTACEPTHLSPLDPEDTIGSAIGLDYPLFGWNDVSCETVYCRQDLYSQELIYTYAFWGGSEEKWNEERLLEVEDCLAYTQADWDNDREMELLIRTRWPEKPYAVYDMEDGAMETIWLDSLEPELAERLMTPGEQQAELERELRSST